MAEGPTNERCKACHEPIGASALRCPRCASWQAGLPVLGHSVCRQLKSLAWFLPMYIVVGMMFLSGLRFFSEGEDFAKYRHELRVVQSDMVFGLRQGERVVAVVGMLKNASPVVWKDIQVEVRFRDADGRLVDATAAYLFLENVLPGRERSFKAEVTPDLPLDMYASHEASVRAATDAASLW